MTDLVGQTIGNYQIEARLGIGGMGQVYRARHIHLDRLGALKLIHETLAFDQSFRERFRREARAIAALRHPNIVEVFDYDEHQGRAYMVMELITGGSLRSLLQRYPAGRERPLAPLLDMVRQAADGLAFAHGRGIIHRDIKPDNLLLATDDRGVVTVKVGDFGLARMTEGSAMTATGAVMGTPAYMSPEQCQGFELDARSDIYALGVVLYEVAAGALPFQARTISEAAYKHVHTAPPPPRQIVPTLPAELERIILRCLEKRPEDRYQSMAELSTELRRLLGQLPAGMTVVTAIAPAQPATPPIAQPAPVVSPSQAGTAIAQPDAAQPVASPLPPPPTAGATPRVQVLDERRQVVRELDLTTAGLTIGRQSRNTIVLDAEAVSRNHARIDWDGQQARITDLGSSNGTLVGERRLTAQSAEIWPPADLARVGPFFLRLVAPKGAPAGLSGAPVGPSVTPPDAMLQQLLSGAATVHHVTTTPNVQPQSGDVLSSRIALSTDSTTLTLTPGMPGLIQVVMANQGATVDHFTLELTGVPAGCMIDPTPVVELLPGRQETLAVTVRAARTPECRAGTYAVILRVRSRSNPSEMRETRMTWTILPFIEAGLAVAPRRVRARTGADYQLSLQNRGNAPLTLRLAGEDDENILRYRFTPAEPTIDPGATYETKLRVEGRFTLVGSAQSRLFRVNAADAQKTLALNAPAEFVQLALLPPWAPPALLALLIGLCLALAQIPAVQQIIGTAPTAVPTALPTATPTPEPGAPNIQLFEVTPSTIAPGETVTVNWAIANPETVDSVEIAQFGTVDTSGSQTDTPRSDTEYRLTVLGKNGKPVIRVVKVFVIDSTATAQAQITPTTVPTDTPIVPTDTPRPTDTPMPTEVPPTPTWTPVPPTVVPGDPGVLPPFRPDFVTGVKVKDRQIVFHNDFPNLNLGAFTDKYEDQTRQNIGKWDRIIAIGDRRLFLYRASDGHGAIVQVQEDGVVVGLRQIAGFSRDWTQITYAGNNFVLFYSANNGNFVLTRMRGDTYEMLGELQSPGRGWSHLVASDEGTVLFYNERSGEGQVGYLSSRGSYSETERVRGFATGWTHLVTAPGRLLFYKSSTGEFVLATLLKGKYEMVTELQSPGKGWTHLTALSDGTLLFVESGSGKRRFMVPAAVGYLDVPDDRPFSAGWRIIVGLR